MGAPARARGRPEDGRRTKRLTRPRFKRGKHARARAPNFPSRRTDQRTNRLFLSNWPHLPHSTDSERLQRRRRRPSSPIRQRRREGVRSVSSRRRLSSSASDGGDDVLKRRPRRFWYFHPNRKNSTGRIGLSKQSSFLSSFPPSLDKPSQAQATSPLGC